MEHRLLRFFQALRSHGLPVSPAETIDAMRAVRECGIDRPTLRTALAACLVKDADDLPQFHHIFDRFFPLHAPKTRAPKRATPSGEGSRLRQRFQQGSEPARKTVERHQHELGPFDPKREVPGRHPGQETEMPGTERMRAASASLRNLLDQPFRAIEVEDLRELQPQLERLARSLARRSSRRTKAAAQGHMDFRRTFRRSIATGGVPCNLAWRRRRQRHTDLLALCDLSHSVAAASHFFLSVLAASQSVFRRCRFLGFVDRPVEITFAGGHVFPAEKLDLSARSDYGSVFHALAQRTGLLSRSTLLVVLGDARTNRRPPRHDLLAQLRQRLRAVVWINPEAEERWNTGDSVISRYAPYCDHVLCASTPKELLAALEGVLHRHA